MRITPMFLTLVDTHLVLSMRFSGNHIGNLTQIVEDDLDFGGMMERMVRCECYMMLMGK